MPLILGANSVSGGYEIDNSLRFNSASSDSLSKTFAVAGNRQIFTFSFWIKRSSLSVAQEIYFTNSGGGTFAQMSFLSGNTFSFGSATVSVSNIDLVTTQVFRDPSAWYHFVVAVDTTQSTASNRVKLYVNGSQVTAFNVATYPAQNHNTQVNTTTIQYIGRPSTGTFGGYFSEYYFIDGQQLTPSSFGETDENTGIWKPIPYTGSFGTNGFYLEFQNSGALGTDSSGNGNTWTVNNLTSIDQTTDTPTNNFATLNPLIPITYTYTEGNLQSTAGAVTGTGSGTIGVSQGKWYFECKLVTQVTNDIVIGIATEDFTFSSTTLGANANGWGMLLQSNFNGQTFYNNAVSASAYTTWANTDICMIAFDLDNSKLYFGRNGTWLNSSNPATGTNAIFTGLTTGKIYFPALRTTNSGVVQMNFGSPMYSANSYTDGAGYGNFSYAVPSGYYSLCTKNLAEYA